MWPETHTLISGQDGRLLLLLKFEGNGKKLSIPWNFPFLFVCDQNTQHNAKQNPFFLYCPAAVSQFTPSVCLITGLFVWRRTGRHGGIVSGAKEENGTVTVERIGSWAQRGDSPHSIRERDRDAPPPCSPRSTLAHVLANTPQKVDTPSAPSFPVKSAFSLNPLFLTRRANLFMGVCEGAFVCTIGTYGCARKRTH